MGLMREKKSDAVQYRPVTRGGLRIGACYTKLDARNAARLRTITSCFPHAADLAGYRGALARVVMGVGYELDWALGPLRRAAVAFE